LKKQTLIIAGVGGRGVLVGSTILLNIAFQQDLPVFSADEYGMSQRGGSVVSHLRIGPYQSPIIGTGGRVRSRDGREKAVGGVSTGGKRLPLVG